jgi:DNA-binding XRE family transcriptional regulator
MSTASDQAPAAQGSLERGADNPVRARRTEHRLTRKELAARAEASASAITGIENGHHRPSVELARRIAEALNSDVRDLFQLRECACGCGGLMVDQARLGSEARFLSGHNCREPEHGATIARAHRARRRRLGIPEEKICEGCGRTFTRSEVPNQPLVHWLSREHCSFTCAHGPPVEWRVCAREGCERKFKPSWSADPSRRHCSVRCAQLDRFEAGNVAEAFVEQMPGRARQRWGGRWNATKPPAPGARPRGRPASELTDDQRAEIRRLVARGWGRRAIANQLLVSERAVRNVLTP